MTGRPSDVGRLLDLFGALGLGATSTSLHMVTIPGAPWSKSRPRFSRGAKVAYSSTDDRDAELRTSWFLKDSIRKPLTGNVGMVCLFFRPNNQRVDTDNLLKHVCDSGNGVIWLDDSQCTALAGIVELDPDNPRTVVMIGHHHTTLKRGSDDTSPCQQCGKPIPLATRDRSRPPQTCSRECRQVLKGYDSLAEPVPCAHCDEPFVRRTKTQRYCSNDCRKASITGQPRGGKSFSNCTDCGRELTHKRGGRCRDCWKLSIPKALK